MWGNKKIGTLFFWASILSFFGGVQGGKTLPHEPKLEVPSKVGYSVLEPTLKVGAKNVPVTRFKKRGKGEKNLPFFGEASEEAWGGVPTDRFPLHHTLTQRIWGLLRTFRPV